MRRRRHDGARLEEIERVYRARLAEFRRVAAAIVGGDRDAARDAVQDAFALAVRERATYRRTGALEAWLWRIVVNAAHDRRRRAPREEELSEPVVEASNGHGEAGDDHVRVAIALLPERQRVVLFLRYYADLDYGTIADAVGISPGTVAATLHAARTSIRRLLQEVPR